MEMRANWKVKSGGIELTPKFQHGSGADRFQF